MEEACAFALAHFQGLDGGPSEGTAVLGLPDQVAKMAQAGEFVPRGGSSSGQEELSLPSPPRAGHRGVE